MPRGIPLPPNLHNNSLTH